MKWIKKHKKAIFITSGIIIFVLVFGAFALSYIGAGVMTYRTSTRLDASPDLISDNYENVEFKATDGVNLKGTFYPKENSDKLVIFITGIIPNRFDQFYMIPAIVQNVLDHGYNVLIYDSRAHGVSDGERLDYGSTSGRDIVGAVDFAKTRGFNPKKIGILGNSTGAVTIVMETGNLKDVGALMLDSVTDNFSEVLVDQIEFDGRAPRFLAPGIFYFVETRFGFDFSNIIPLDHIGEDPNRAFLFLQGEDDSTTPYASAMNLYKHANPKSTFVTFKKTGHVESYRMNHKLWESSVYTFLDQQLAK